MLRKDVFPQTNESVDFRGGDFVGRIASHSRTQAERERLRQVVVDEHADEFVELGFARWLDIFGARAQLFVNARNAVHVEVVRNGVEGIDSRHIESAVARIVYHLADEARLSAAVCTHDGDLPMAVFDGVSLSVDVAW